MAKLVNTRTANSNQTRKRPQLSLLPTAAIAFAAAITGTVVGFVATLAVAMPMMHQALATEVSGVNARLASSLTPDEQACIETGQAGESGAVLGAETAAASPSAASSQSSAGGQGGGPGNVTKNITKNIFINKLIGGQLATTTAVIKNTGPESSNEVITKNISVTKVTNTNDVNVSNTNDQSTVSGSANVSGNTNGGSAVTGTADNTNDTSLALTINN